MQACRLETAGPPKPKADFPATTLQHNEGCSEISRRIWRSAPPLLEAFFPRRQDRPPSQFLRRAVPSSSYTLRNYYLGLEIVHF